MHTLRSVHSRCFCLVVSLGFLCIVSMSPLYFSEFSTVGTLRQVIFWEPRRRRVLRCRGLGGVAGSPGVRLPGDPSPISLSDSLHRHVVVTIHIARQGTRLKQPPNNHQTTTKQPPNNHQTTTKQPPNNHQTTAKQPPNNRQTTAKQPPNNRQTTAKQHTNNTQTTHKQHTNNTHHAQQRQQHSVAILAQVRGYCPTRTFCVLGYLTVAILFGTLRFISRSQVRSEQWVVLLFPIRCGC